MPLLDDGDLRLISENSPRGTVPMTSDHVEQIRSILNAAYPDWEGPSDPRFVADEIDYKRAAIEKASSRLSKSALSDLIERERFTEVIERLEELGRERHFLYVATPRTGDLSILHDPGLDEEVFAGRILDLLYGDGDSPERLERYAEWVDQEGLPNKWTFPTYFLFLTHPDQDLFIKPRAVGRFLDLVDAGFTLGSRPNGDLYSRVLELAGELKKVFLEGDDDDMVPVQSLIWVAGRRGYDMGVGALGEDRQDTLERLLEEFSRTFVSTEEGESHLAIYPELRETAQHNFEQVITAKDNGQEITDLVLTKLLPHRDTAANRARGAWVHVAPAIQGDLRTWFENIGWVEPEDWPQISQAILEFVEQVVKDPDSLEDACQRFADSDYNKGFQTGMLTPILSALVPDQLILINMKTRAVVNHFLELKYSQKIDDYPALNTAAHYLINRLREPLVELLPAGVTAQEGFDAFSHWLVAIKGYRFGRTQAWKITVEDPSNWTLWVEGGYAGLSEPVLPDLTSTKKKDWEDQRAEALAVNSGTTGERLDEVWNLANEAQEGDMILGTRGTDRVLGLGMVIGPYEYHGEGEPQHRIPVDWQDTEPRPISEPGWRKRFHEVESEKFEKVSALRPVVADEGEGAFSRRSFELLEEIHETPTREYYSEHQNDFRAHVEEPLKQLMTEGRRVKNQDPVTTRYVAQLFEAMGVDCVVALEVHNQSAFDNAFRCRTVHLEARSLFVNTLMERVGKDPVVIVSPDAGGTKRVDRFRDAWAAIAGEQPPTAFLEKRRSDGKVTGDAVVGDMTGRVAIIVDDMVASGTTLLRAAEACKNKGATKVFGVITHALFGPGSEQLYRAGAMDQLFVTDSVTPQQQPDNQGRVTTLPVAGLFAQAVRDLHTD